MSHFNIKIFDFKKLGTFGTFGTSIYILLNINKLYNKILFQNLFQAVFFWNKNQKNQKFVPNQQNSVPKINCFGTAINQYCIVFVPNVPNVPAFLKLTQKNNH